MKDRRKILMLAGTALAGVLFLFFLADQIVFSPAGRARREITSRTHDIEDKKIEKVRQEQAKARLAELYASTLGLDAGMVSDDVNDRLPRILEHAGLAKGMNVSRLSPRPFPGGKTAQVEVSAKGVLRNIVHLLFVLKAEPYPHRIENFSIFPASGDLSVKFTYAVIVPDVGKAAAKITTLKAKDLQVAGTEKDARKVYDLIETRNIFTRHVEPPSGPSPKPTSQPNTPPPPPNPPEDHRPELRISALPFWGGKQDIFVTDSQTNTTSILKVGDDLAGGKIVAVDYRLMQDPRDPELMTQARVIVKIGDTYWAIDVTRKVQEKWRMTPDQLPPELLKQIQAEQSASPSSQPAEKVIEEDVEESQE